MLDVLIMLPNLIFDSPGSEEKDQYYFSFIWHESYAYVNVRK
jgi:hypothetical protein